MLISIREALIKSPNAFGDFIRASLGNDGQADTEGKNAVLLLGFNGSAMAPDDAVGNGKTQAIAAVGSAGLIYPIESVIEMLQIFLAHGICGIGQGDLAELVALFAQGQNSGAGEGVFLRVIQEDITELTKLGFIALNGYAFIYAGLKLQVLLEE